MTPTSPRVASGVLGMMLNSGQSCNAPSRMLVPNSQMDEAIAVAPRTAKARRVGDPGNKTAIGPVVSKTQFDKIQGLIQRASTRVPLWSPAAPAGLMGWTPAITSNPPSSPASPTT